ncbi:MAG: hypothetical protein AAF390_00995 [Pseudomonadota bacterium]
MTHARTTILVLALVLPLLLVVAVWLQPFTAPRNLLRDPLVVAATFQENGWPCCSNLLGAVSSVGTMVWTVAATLCAFVATMLWLRRAEADMVLFFATAAAFSLWLMLDDGFMIHETYKLGTVAGLSLTAWPLVLFSAALLVQAVRLRDRIDWPLLLWAFWALGASWLIDKFAGHPALHLGGRRAFVEDAFKVFGIFAWAGCFARQSLVALAGVPDTERRMALQRNPKKRGTASEMAGT